jgi:hypothetical protein
MRADEVLVQNDGRSNSLQGAFENAPQIGTEVVRRVCQ